MDDGETCVLCKHLKDWQNHSSDDVIFNVGARGLATMVMVSRTMRKDGFHNTIEGHDSIKVHKMCRCRYIKPASTPETKNKRLRMEKNSHDVDHDSDQDVEPVPVQAHFNFSEQCVICAKKIHNKTPFSTCTSEDTRKNVINYLQEESTLELSVREEILDKLSTSDDPDEIVQDIKYHRNCFRKDLYKKKTYQTDYSERIRQSMDQIFNYMTENPNKELLQEKDMLVPTEKTIWNRIKDRFHQDIVYERKRRSGTYCCFKDQAFNVMQQAHKKGEDDELDHFKLLDKVAKILVEDIRGYECDSNMYPASDRMLEKAKIIPGKLIQVKSPRENRGKL